MATVNSWEAADMLKWIKVCLAGRAQKALQSLPEETRADYTIVKAERFELPSNRELYNAELQVRTK